MSPSAYVLEGEETIREGETRRPVVVWSQFSSISTAGTQAYVNGSTDSAILSGTTSVIGNTQTLPLVTIPSGYGGLTIVIEPATSAAGAIYKTGIILRVLRPGES